MCIEPARPRSVQNLHGPPRLYCWPNQRKYREGRSNTKTGMFAEWATKTNLFADHRVDARAQRLRNIAFI